VDDVLRALTSSTVQLLTVQSVQLAMEGARPEPEFSINRSGQQVPRAKVLIALLTAKPSLSCQAVLCPRAECTEEESYKEYLSNTQAEWDAAMEILSSIHAIFPERMQILHQPGLQSYSDDL
jgi:hypothetical protein